MAAYYGGLLDEALMCLTDILLSFPVLLLALLTLSTLGSAMIYLVLFIDVIFAPAIARWFWFGLLGDGRSTAVTRLGVAGERQTQLPAHSSLGDDLSSIGDLNAGYGDQLASRRSCSG